MMNYSEAGLALTKRFEGCKLTAYRDSGGVWTIGFGHTNGVMPSQICNHAQADAWLMQDIQYAVIAVNNLVKVPLTQCQFDGLVDFTFNLGEGALETSTLLDLLNQGDYEGAANQFPRWNHCKGQVLPGLTARRNAEMEMFEGAILHLEKE